MTRLTRGRLPIELRRAGQAPGTSGLAEATLKARRTALALRPNKAANCVLIALHGLVAADSATRIRGHGGARLAVANADGSGAVLEEVYLIGHSVVAHKDVELR